MKANLILKKSHSEKAQKDYVAVCIDLGYRVMHISYKTFDNAELCGLNIREYQALIEALPVGQSVLIGVVDFVDKVGL